MAHDTAIGVVADGRCPGRAASLLDATALRYLHNVVSYADAVVFGQPDFFTPRNPFTLFLPDAPSQDVSSSQHHTNAGYAEALRNVSGRARRGGPLSLGVTDVESGTGRSSTANARASGRCACSQSGSPSAGLSGDVHRRPALLGWRLRIEYAARRDRGALRPCASRSVRDRPLEPRGKGAAKHERSTLASEADSLCLPQPLSPRYGCGCARLRQAAHQLRTRDEAVLAVPKDPAFQRSILSCRLSAGS